MLTFRAVRSSGSTKQGCYSVGGQRFTQRRNDVVGIAIKRPSQLRKIQHARKHQEGSSSYIVWQPFRVVRFLCGKDAIHSRPEPVYRGQTGFATWTRTTTNVQSSRLFRSFLNGKFTVGDKGTTTDCAAEEVLIFSDSPCHRRFHLPGNR